MQNVYYIITLDELKTLFSGSAVQCMDYLFFMQMQIIDEHGLCLIGEKSFRAMRLSGTIPDK